MKANLPNTDLAVIGRLFSLLEPKERRVIFTSLVIRLLLVVLDIGGLSLIGISVSLVSGTHIDQESLTGKVLVGISNIGLNNSYALFGFASVCFFIAKALASIRLNTFVLNKVADIEAAKSASLLRKISRGTLDDLTGLSKKELFVALVDSFDMSVSKLVMSFSTVFGEAVLLIGIGLYLFFTSPALLLIMGAYFALLGYLMQRLVSRKTRQTAQIGQESSIASSNVIFDIYDNFRQLASLNKFDYLLESYSKSRNTLSRATATMSSLSVMPRYITEIALMLGFALLIFQRSIPGATGLSAATLGVFIAAAFRIIASLLPLQGSLALFKQIAGSSRLAIDLSHRYSTQSETANQVVSETLPHNEFAVAVRNLTYNYPGHLKPVLSDLSLDIRSRDYLAIMGKSGSGKSTLADLILGLREPTEGSITINGLNVRDYLRLNPGTIAYVPQKCNVLEGTLRFNVSLSGTTASDVEIHQALSSAGLKEWVDSLDHGLDTQLGESARNLSGGQIQRLGLARALLSKPKLLILDESTSALDKETEEKILATIDSLRGDIAILAIAHRGNVIDHADRTIRF